MEILFMFFTTIFETWITFLFVSVIAGRQDTLAFKPRTALFAAIVTVRFLCIFLLPDTLFVVLTTVLSVCLTARLAFRLSWLWAGLAIILHGVLGTCAEFLMSVLVSSTFQSPLSETTHFSTIHVFSLFASDLFELFAIKIFAGFRRGKIGQTEPLFSVPMFFLPPLSIAMMVGFFHSADAEVTPSGFLIAESIGLSSINIFIFVLAEGFIRRGEQARLLLQLQAQNAIAEEHIRSLTQSSQVRHDFRQTLHTLRGLSEAGKTEELATVVRELSDIQPQALVDTGNPYFDALLTAKQSLAKESGIVCRWAYTVPPNCPTLKLSVCVMLGNILDNAIEACAKVDGEKWIEFHDQTIGDKLLFVVRNPIATQPKPDGNLFKTSKSDSRNHGFGLRSVQNTLNDLGGAMEIFVNETVFEIRVMISQIA